MISVPAHRVRQFGVEFYQACFSAADIRRLVRFEVLGYTEAAGAKKGAGKRPAPGINWDLLERRITQSESAYQRPVIQRKIGELTQYYRQCREQRNLPAIPGAVIIISERRLAFKAAGKGPAGTLEIPEDAGILRALDGQHRLLALEAAGAEDDLEMDVPAVLFDSLAPNQIVELFVTINAKHTRLNPSHLLSLAGRRLYANPHQALAHDIIRKLNEDDSSPLYHEIRMLGVGLGKVSQASLNEEMVDLFEQVERLGGPQRRKEFEASGIRFFLNYFKALQQVFPKAWAGKKYSIKTGVALRAFVRVVPDVMDRARQAKGDPFDFNGIREAVKPWADHLGDRRFETEGDWKRTLTGGTRGTVDLVVRDLRDALRR
jgi:DGQHR domain-containing protein